MAEPLIELSTLLESKSDRDKITDAESLLIRNCKAKAVDSFFIGALVSSAAVYTVTNRLRRLDRVFFSAVSGVLAGKFVFDRTINACLEHILNIDGSRMQRELANIIVRKYRESPSKMQLVYKHFFPERVFNNEQDPDRLLLRWRFRNAYIDDSASRTSEEYGDYTSPPIIDSESSKQQYISNFGAEFLVDPFDCIMGNLEQTKEIPRSDADGSGVPRRPLHAAHKRARRHRGARHAENFPS